MIWWQFLLFLLAVPVSVELSVRIRWREIKGMFDRALIHGGSLDTLSKAMRAASEESNVKATEALRQANGAVEAVALLHKEVKALKEHPMLRPLGGNGHKDHP